MGRCQIAKWIGISVFIYLTGEAAAADRYWWGQSGTWSDGTKWNTKADGTGSSGVPQNGDQVFCRLAGDTNYTIDFDTAQTPNISLAHLELDSLGGFAGYFDQTLGSITSSAAYIGVNGPAIYWQTGGTHTVNGTLTVAQNSGSTGTYVLQSGTLNVTGNLSGGSGDSFLMLRGGGVSLGGTINLSEIWVDPQVAGTYSYTLGSSPQMALSTQWTVLQSLPP